jgi:hypothetical protein
VIPLIEEIRTLVNAYTNRVTNIMHWDIEKNLDIVFLANGFCQ